MSYEYLDEEAKDLSKELFEFNDIVKTLYGIKEGFTDFKKINNMYFIRDNQIIRAISGQVNLFRFIIQERFKGKGKRITPTNIIYNLCEKDPDLRIPLNCVNYYRFYKEYKDFINKVIFNDNEIEIKTEIPNIAYKEKINKDMEFFFDVSDEKFSNYYNLLSEENLLFNLELTSDEYKDIFSDIVKLKQPKTIYFNLDEEGISLKKEDFDNSLKFIFHIKLCNKIKKTDTVNIEIFDIQEYINNGYIALITVSNNNYTYENLFIIINYIK